MCSGRGTPSRNACCGAGGVCHHFPRISFLLTHLLGTCTDAASSSRANMAASPPGTPWPADIDPSTWTSAPAAKGAGTDAVKETEAFVKAAMADNDASHDFAHIARVRNTALKLAAEEGHSENADFLEMVELAALLHDVNDWKYAKEGAWRIPQPPAV